MTGEPLGPPSLDQGEEDDDDERLGCADLVTALAGFGCAMAVRALIIGIALLALILYIRFAGGGSPGNRLPTLTPTSVGMARDILGDAVHGRAFGFLDLLHFQE